MVAVGAAVNEMREAQSLMMPIMLLLMAPWILRPADRARAELDLQHGHQLHPAGQHVRHADAHDLGLAAAAVAGAGRCRRARRRRRGDLVRRQGVPDRPADVRQAADVRDPPSLGATGVSGRPRYCRGSGQGAVTAPSGAPAYTWRMPLASWLFVNGTDSIWVERRSGA